MRIKLLRNQRDFYANALDEADAADLNGWIVGSENDRTRTQEFLRVMRRHRVEIRPLTRETTVGGTTFEPGHSYVISADQSQFKLIKSSMETTTAFRDSIFYDVSTWTLPLAFGITHEEFSGNISSISGDPIDEITLDGGHVYGGMSDYAYVMPWGRYYAPRALQGLLEAGVPARVSLETIETTAAGQAVYFDRGAVVVPVRPRGGNGSVMADSVYRLVQRLAARDHVEFYSVASGLTPGGIDLGSPRTLPLKRESVGIFSGSPLSGYRVGEAWHLLSRRMRMPASLIDLGRVEGDRTERL